MFNVRLIRHLTALLSWAVVVSLACAPTAPEPEPPPTSQPPTASAPTIALSRTAVTISAAAGGANPAAETVTITNGGTGTLSGVALGTITTQPSGGTWLTASIDRDTGPVTLTLAASIGSLSPGTYTATVPVTASGAGNSPQSISVTLTVAAVPVIAVSRTTVTFAAVPGGSSPAAQTVQVTNGGTGTLDGLSVSAPAYGPGASGWLTATLGASTAPATLTLGATIGSLAPGSYSATVQLAAATTGVAPLTITVQFNVTAEPRIGLTPVNLAFTSIQGGAAPAAQQVAITNTGTGTLDGLSVGVIGYGPAGAGWLTAVLSGPSAPATLAVSVNASSLPPGDYSATIPLSALGAANSPQSVGVSLRVDARPTLSVSPATIALTAVAGGASPSARTVTISSTGGSVADLIVGAPTYAAGASGWLTATLSGSTTPATLAISATTGTLAPGTYTASVPVQSATAGNAPVTVGVTFTIAAPAVLALDPGSVTFSATRNGSAPPARTVTVTSTSGTPATGLTVGAPQYQGGATGWLAVELLGTTTPATLRLTATPGALAVGTYSASLAVSGAASNSPQSLGVTLTVSAPTSLLLSEDTVRFAFRRGEGQQPDGSVGVTSSDGSVLPFLTTTVTSAAPSNWFALQLPASSTPTTALVRTSIGPLPPGLSRAIARVQSGATGPSAELVAEVQITGAPAFTQLTAGLTANCGLTAAGDIWCWGGNGFGELGNRWIEGSIVQSNFPRDTLDPSFGGWGSGYPVPVHGPDGVTFTAVAMGNAHTCAIASNGDVYCWGANGTGQVGDGTRNNRLRPYRVPLPGGARARAVSLGGRHSCAITTDDAVWCWGENLRGQLGDGTVEDTEPPYGVLTLVRALLPTGVTPAAISADGEHTCILTGEGTVWCWGAIGSLRSASPVAVLLPDGLRFRSITSGYYFACGVSTADEAWCWGTGTSAELGNGLRTSSDVPVRVALPPGVSVRSLSAGDRHSCAVLSTEALYCWGRQGNGAFGDGIESSAVFDPIQIALPAGASFQQIAAGTFHSCALTASGAAWCGGKNFYGLIGNGEIQGVIGNRLPPLTWRPIIP